MTITNYDGVAILPKRCDRCNRLFWLEPYNTYYRTVGIECWSLKHIECKNCIGNEKKPSELHIPEIPVPSRKEDQEV